MVLATRNANPLTTEHFRATPTGLEITGEPSFEEWVEYGDRLGKCTQSAMWCYGDWLVYGGGRRKEWGEKYDAAVEHSGRSYGVSRVAAHVSERFDLLRRLNNLPWCHHQAVAPLLPGREPEATALLEEAAEMGLTVKEVRERVKLLRAKSPPEFVFLVALGELREKVGALVKKIADTWPEEARHCVPVAIADLANDLAKEYPDAGRGEGTDPACSEGGSPDVR